MEKCALSRNTLSGDIGARNNRNKTLVNVKQTALTAADGGPLLIAETDDMFVSFLPNSKVVGPINILDQHCTHDFTSYMDKAKYDTFIQLPDISNCPK